VSTLSLSAPPAGLAADWVGRQVRVPKGAPVRNNHPHTPESWYPAGRSQTVTVFDAYLEEGQVILSWLGSARYWKDVRAADVQVAS
jgi:hypothetical protein